MAAVTLTLPTSTSPLMSVRRGEMPKSRSGEITVGPFTSWYTNNSYCTRAADSTARRFQQWTNWNQRNSNRNRAIVNGDSETVSQTIHTSMRQVHILNMLLEALPVAATVEEDGSIIITQEDLLANARDLDGDQLTALNLATDDDSAGILQITVMAHTHWHQMLTSTVMFYLRRIHIIR